MNSPPPDPLALRQQGFALAQAQRLDEAAQLFAEAVRAFPNDPALTFGLAQCHYELGYPAADLFARASALAPGHGDTARNHALALISEGRSAEARGLLADRLARHTDWLDGHKALATLNWTSGQARGFADHIGAAARTERSNADLWLAWFRNLAQARDWADAAAVLDEAQHNLGDSPAMAVSRLFLAVESGASDAGEWIARTAHIRGDVPSLCRIRHALRMGEPALAEAEALPLTQGPSAMLYWPYLSLAWRLLGDGRAEWLDRPDDLIQALDSGIDAGDLALLADVLRGLHTQARPYIEQSVRGGTQTDRSVLLRHEPELQAIKAQLLELVRGYVDNLPPSDPDHPLLSASRGGPLLIEGSWSVRLESQGHNVPHTHAMGWLSTAFYVALPRADQLGSAPAGHIAFGQPPPELGLALEPYCTIQPAPGRLAVFPSTIWHGTVPFDTGERLVIAFDIKRPRAQ